MPIAHLVIPAGSAEAEVNPAQLFGDTVADGLRVISVVGNGNDYCAAEAAGSK